MQFKRSYRFISYHWLFQSYRAKHFFVIFSKQFLGFFYYICDTKLIVILWPRILAGIWGVCHHQESKDLLRTDKWNSYHVLTQNLTFIADAIFQQFQVYLPSQYTNKTVMRIWQLEIEKPNSSHYLLSGITRGGVFMWISVKNLKICNGYHNNVKTLLNSLPNLFTRLYFSISQFQIWSNWI